MKPQWLLIAEKEIGVYEMPGEEQNHPRIIEYHNSVIGNTFLVDEISWCSPFVNWSFCRTLIRPAHTHVARLWLQWGRELKNPAVGAVVVLKRGKESWQGHVGFVAAWTDTKVQVLGGNQSNQVCLMWFDRADVLGYRWPLVLETLKVTPAWMKEKQIEYLGEEDVKIENTELRIKIAWYRNPKLIAWMKSLGDVALGVLSLIPQTRTLGAGLTGVKELALPKKKSRLAGLTDLLKRLFDLILTWLKGLKK